MSYHIFAKAFDVTGDDLLLRKISLYELSNETLHLIVSFLWTRDKGIIVHKIVAGCAHSSLKFYFLLNQNRHLQKRIVPRPRLDLFKCSLIYSGGNFWNTLPLRIKILTDHKVFKKAYKQTLMEKSSQTLIIDMCTIYFYFYF